MGKPFLSARVRGIQEFLVEGVEAEYFDAGNATDLLKKIIEYNLKKILQLNGLLLKLPKDTSR